MTDRRPHDTQDTERPLPRVEGAPGELADALRAEPARVDDLTRARLERSLVEAWRTRPAAHVALPAWGRGSASGRFPSRALWAGSLAAAALIGVGLGLQVFGKPTGEPLAADTARFELRVGDAAMQTGSVGEGQELESGPHGQIAVTLGGSRIDFASKTRVRFDRLSDEELRFSLVAGQVDVDFEPVTKGEQKMAVETRSARVLVVGTRFRVAADARGNTTVEVREGVVEVVPRSGAPSRRLAVGERWQVSAEDGDAYERAVRASIEAELAAGEPAAQERVEAANEAEDDTLDMDFGAEPDALAGEGAQAEGAALGTVTGQLGTAQRLLRDGRHGPARARLWRVVEGPHPSSFRAEALTLIAESHTAQGQVEEARVAYERAARVAPSHRAGHNALFALARLLERHTRERADAIEAYEHYLERAPRGALAGQARAALCRLGESAHCD